MISQDPRTSSTSYVLGPNYMKAMVYQLCPPEVTVVTHIKFPSASLNSFLELSQIRVACRT